MRRFLLDTTPLAGFLQGRPDAVALVDPWLVRREAATSILVYGEIAEYLMGRPDFAGRDAQVRRLLREIIPYIPTYSTLRRYAAIRRQLRPPYGPGLIGDIDTLVAATALERGLTLVTTDSDHVRVRGLEVMLLDRRTLRLEQPGLTAMQPPRGDSGFMTASVVDPFGNVLGIMQNPHWLESHGGPAEV